MKCIINQAEMRTIEWTGQEKRFCYDENETKGP